MTTVPFVDLDIFSDDVQLEPWATYAELRELAPVVHLRQPTYEAYAITRYADVRGALLDWRSFTSSKGIAFNPLMNERAVTAVVGSDPPEHTHRRAVLQNRLKLSEVRSLRDKLQAKADAIVADVVAAGRFDVVSDLAQRFVSRAVGELIGVSEEVIEPFRRDGHTFFTAVGPPNEHFDTAWPVVSDLLALLADLTKDDVRPGTIGWDLFAAAEHGELPPEMCAVIMGNVLTGAALSTTISGIATTIHLLARNPEQWDLLRADPGRATAAFEEGLRVESPVQVWGRVCDEGAALGGYEIPAGSRVAVLIGSANRDERHFEDPDRFDIERPATDNLAFGWGVHRCVGAPLATAEATAVLTAFAEQVSHVSLVGEPQRRPNNTLRSLSSLPVSVR